MIDPKKKYFVHLRYFYPFWLAVEIIQPITALKNEYSVNNTLNLFLGPAPGQKNINST